MDLLKKKSDIDTLLNDIVLNNELIKHDKDIKKALLSDPEAVKRIIEATVIDELKQDIHKKKVAAKLPYYPMVKNFIDTIDSEYTKKAYTKALHDYYHFYNPDGTTEQRNPLLSNKTDFANFINVYLEDKSPSTIRLKAAAISAFYQYLLPYSDYELENITKDIRLPKKKAVNKNKFYMRNTSLDNDSLRYIANDIEKIERAVKDPVFMCIIFIMACRGLRCGSFEHITIKDNNFTTISKGKQISGTLPGICIDAIKTCNFNYKEFNQWTENRVKCLFKYYTTKLYKAGTIAYPYSCHDLRHFYAINEYNKLKDIYKLSKLLDHTSISVTERYLKGLGVKL